MGKKEKKQQQYDRTVSVDSTGHHYMIGINHEDPESPYALYELNPAARPKVVSVCMCEPCNYIAAIK